MTETIELSIDSKLEFVDLVSSVTKEITTKMGFDEDDAKLFDAAGFRWVYAQPANTCKFVQHLL